MPAVKRIAEVESLPVALPSVVELVEATFISELMEFRARMELNELP
jgi:hypothetical protein